ncbi:hypothetical protein [Microbulbifer sp. ARAS458-1]|uniref:hypothetical protein n=1 Tax=Microbulbifer sp. ARAS458-1 TaxID=3140242 RepID=UPI003877970E
MQNKFAPVLALIITSLISACASSPSSVENPNWSRAKNLVQSAGMGGRLKDTEGDPSSARISGMSKGTEWLVTTPAYGGILSPMGMLNTFEIIMKPKSPDERIVVFGWMPRKMASSQDEAYKLYFDIIEESMINGATNAGLDVPERLRRSKFENSFLKKPKSFFILGDGNGCSTAKSTFSHGNLICGFRAEMRGDTTSTKAPSILGGYESWALLPDSAAETSRLMPIYQMVQGTDVELTDKPAYRFNELNFLIQFSKSLPDWMFIYIPPSAVTVDNNGRFLNAPAVLEQGNLNLFVSASPTQ